MYERGDLLADADPGKLATATLAALQGGLLLTKLNRDTEPLEAALDVILDHVRSLQVPRARDHWKGDDPATSAGPSPAFTAQRPAGRTAERSS
jgi:hypothetical protein